MSGAVASAWNSQDGASWGGLAFAATPHVVTWQVVWPGAQAVMAEVLLHVKCQAKGRRYWRSSSFLPQLLTHLLFSSQLPLPILRLGFLVRCSPSPRTRRNTGSGCSDFQAYKVLERAGLSTNHDIRSVDRQLATSCIRFDRCLVVVLLLVPIAFLPVEGRQGALPPSFCIHLSRSVRPSTLSVQSCMHTRQTCTPAGHPPPLVNSTSSHSYGIWFSLRREHNGRPCSKNMPGNC